MTAARVLTSLQGDRMTGNTATFASDINAEAVNVSMKQCSRCRENPRAPNQRYCLPCHAAYHRDWRKTHPLTIDQRKRDTARSYANSYQKRGKLKKQPCEKCGSPDSQKHHPDYDKPLEVEWLCRKCHLEHHNLLRRQSLKQNTKVKMIRQLKRIARKQAQS